jgi:ribosomal protein S12 methylthiotransferase accessory factor
LAIPAYYTIVPGAHFRERSANTSVGMFSAKLLADRLPPGRAIIELLNLDEQLPGKYYLKFYLGMCHQALQQLGAAYGYFGEALECDPDNQDRAAIYSYMGACLKDMGKYREAIDTLAKGIQLDADRTDLFNLMGFCHFKLKNHQRAIDCFQTVLALDPGSAIDYANIASNYREMGNKEKAIEFYSKAVAIDPGIEFAWDNLRKLQ